MFATTSAVLWCLATDSLLVKIVIYVAAFDKMSHLSFEKDDDSKGHIDFITAASVRCNQCQTC